MRSMIRKWGAIVRKMILALLLMMLAAITNAGTVYVGADGVGTDDANPGRGDSPGDPYATLQYAVSTGSSGDTTVVCLVGTHSGSTWFYLNAAHDGRNIIIQSDTGDASDTELAFSHANYGAVISTTLASGSLTFENLEISASGNSMSVGRVVNNGSDGNGVDLTLTGCILGMSADATAQPLGNSGTGTGKTMTVTNCTIDSDINCIAATAACDLVISGGTWTSGDSVLENVDFGDVTITNGTFTVTDVGFKFSSTTDSLVMNGCTVNSTGRGIDLDSVPSATLTNVNVDSDVECLYVNGTAAITISGGTWECGNTVSVGVDGLRLDCDDSAASITVDGITMTHKGTYSAGEGGISGESTTEGAFLSITNCTITYEGCRGIYIPSYFDDVIVKNNHVSTANNTTTSVGILIGIDGPTNSNPLGNVFVSGNVCKYTGSSNSHAMEIGSGADSAEVSYNYLDGGDIQLVIKSEYVKAHHNVCVDNKGILLKGAGFCSVSNNTVYSDDSYCISWSTDTDEPVNNTVVGNIFYASGAVPCLYTIINDDRENFWDSNLYYTAHTYIADFGGSDLADLANLRSHWDAYAGIHGSTIDDNSIGKSVDPLMVDPANGDVRLKPGSPCVNAIAKSIGVGGDTVIGNIDIGASGRFGYSYETNLSGGMQ